MRLLFAALLALGAPGARAQAPTMLAGYDQYRFGMTPAQVQALPNTLWGQLQTVSFQRPEPLGGVGTVHIFRGQQPVPVEGQSFDISVFFDPQRGLNEIQLTARLSDRPVAECEREFQPLLARFEKRYGVFYPNLPEGRLPEGTKVEIPPLPGGGSRYAVVAGPGMIGASGVRRYGPTALTVGMNSDGRSTCALTLHFLKKE